MYGEYYEELYQSRYSPGNYEKDIELYKEQPDFYLFTCRLVGIDHIEFERLNQTLEVPLEEEAFTNGAVAFVSKNFTEGDHGIVGKKVRFSVSDPFDQKEETIEIGALLEDHPAYYSAGYTPDLIVSEDYFQKLVNQPLVEMVKIDYDEPFSKSTEASILDLLKDHPLLSSGSKLERYSEMKNSENQITVLGGSIGLIVMLLALSNYLNMMSASIQNRSKEFAVLESIGMTRKQIKNMVLTESLCYGGMSIALSVLLGLPTGYFVFEGLNLYGIPFSFPLARNLVLFFSVLVICAVSSLLLLRRTKDESIIELLRRGEM